MIDPLRVVLASPMPLLCCKNLLATKMRGKLYAE